MQQNLATHPMSASSLADMADVQKPLQPLPVQHHYEIDQLIGDFNQMLGALNQREQTLAHTERFSKAILDSVTAEIAVLDRDGVILAVNQPWLRFSLENGTEPGKPAAHTQVGTNYMAVCRSSSDDTACQDAVTTCEGIQAVLDGRSPGFSREYPCDSPQKKRWFSLVVTPLGPHQQGVVVSHDDITVRKQAELALVQARAEAEKANHAKSRFLAAASHDLRQPLSALSLYVGVLKNRTLPANDALVSNIQECVNSLSELLTDLLDVSKLDAGVVTPRLTDFGLHEFLAARLSIHAAEAQQKGLQLRLRCGNCTVRSDQQLLQRIVNNLVANAIRYTTAGGVLIACRQHQGRRWIEVWDTGMGIPKDQAGNIFEEFVQLGDLARNRGSGLGLAIVACTAAVLGLKIHMQSRVGRGSMFAVELPDGQPVAPAPVKPAVRTTARPLVIAVVEDNEQVLCALVTLLECAGHRVLAATSADQLIDTLGDQRPDVVVSDYRLAGGQTGFDVIEAARAIFGPQVPAIIITGDTDPALIRTMASRGIAVYYKPVQSETLLEILQATTTIRSL